MRDPARIPKILEKVRRIWEAEPDLRLGQLIWNAKMASRYHVFETDQMEDEMIEEGLDWLIEHIVEERGET